MQRGIALFGNNISYSISPVIHNTAFEITNLPYTYFTVDIHPDRFAKAIDAVQTLNFAGANVTIPYKETVMQYTSSVSSVARKIGAVNTLIFKDDKVLGDNTDSAGFFNAYISELQSLENKTVLILGAGGAARAVCDALITNITPRKIIIATRNNERSQRLYEHVREVYGFDRTETIPLAGIEKFADTVDSIIQTTPVGSGLHTGESPLPGSFRFQREHIAIDLIYNPIETIFLKQAARQGARTRNGISMLLHQAGLSFTLWTGVTFPMDNVIPVVMEHIKRRT
jgi:shikimate dehydrogenase